MTELPQGEICLVFQFSTWEALVHNNRGRRRQHILLSIQHHHSLSNPLTASRKLSKTISLLPLPRILCGAHTADHHHSYTNEVINRALSYVVLRPGSRSPSVEQQNVLDATLDELIEDGRRDRTARKTQIQHVTSRTLQQPFPCGLSRTYSAIRPAGCIFGESVAICEFGAEKHI
jgi:hypothetical protein